jgi:predicted transposase/invertase (TIGR01784 family)
MRKKTPILPLTKPYIVSFLSDYGFKITFANKNNTLFARKAIEILLDEPHPIQKLTLLRNELQGIAVEARTGIYDVVCEDELKRVFIVEMQVDNYEHLIERLQYYAYLMFVSIVSKGKNGFDNLKPIHCICIIKGGITESTKYHQVVTLKNEENEIVMDNIIFHIVELGKFPIAKKDYQLITTKKEELLYTMKYAHKFKEGESVPFWSNDYYKSALDSLNTSSMSPIDKALYASSLVRAQVVENKQKKDIEKAVEDTKEKTIFKSVEKALLIGRLTNEDIAELNDVSVDFVKKIKQKLKNKKE